MSEIDGTLLPQRPLSHKSIKTTATPLDVRLGKSLNDIINH